MVPGDRVRMIDCRDYGNYGVAPGRVARYLRSGSLLDSYGCRMGKTIRQSELRNNNAEIMHRVAEGESFAVTVHGRVVADLVPHQRGRPRRSLVPAAEFDEVLADAGPGPDVALWTREMAAHELFGDDAPFDPWVHGRAG